MVRVVAGRAAPVEPGENRSQVARLSKQTCARVGAMQRLHGGLSDQGRSALTSSPPDRGSA
ncbi:MAG TPA: hypothetical protein PK694_07680, partial [Rhodospirillales bacterium]|nr:hypothetical protein [Rhodospirillales bacterium]